MTHDDAILYVPDLGKGRLEPEMEDAVRAHVADCEECSGVAQTYAVLAAALRLEREHPGPADLVAHAMGATIRPEIATHLAACPACSRQDAAIRAAESGLKTTRIPVRAWAAWAAVVAVPLLLGYFGWVQLSVLPRMRDAVARAQVVASASPETISLPLLTPVTRGGGGPVAVAIGAGQRSVVVAVAPALPSDLGDSEPLRIEVRGPGAAVFFSRELAAGEIRRLTGKSGAFALVVPSSVLPEGDAVLSIRSPSRGELLAAPIRVRRE